MSAAMAFALPSAAVPRPSALPAAAFASFAKQRQALQAPSQRLLLPQRRSEPSWIGRRLSYDPRLGRRKAPKTRAGQEADGGSKGSSQAPTETLATSTLPAASFSLVKNIVGCGVLSLPAGAAAISSSPTVLWAASLLIFLIGGMSGYCFLLIARVCAATGTSTYADAWSRAVSAKTAWIISAALLGITGFGCLSYSIILADAASAVAQSAGLPALIAARTPALVLLSASVLLPLCFLETFALLRYSSLTGIAGLLYTLSFMTYRWLEGSYLPGGRFYQAVADAGGLASSSTSSAAAPLLLISMLSTAFVVHYNAPKFYRELEKASIARFARLSWIGFSFAGIVFTAFTGVGFLTFGPNAAGFILNSYAANDALAGLARLAIILSTICSYPLVFAGLREGILELLAARKDRLRPAAPSRRYRRMVATCLLGLITLLALVFRDLSQVNALGGALLGSALIYVFPGMLFLGATRPSTGGLSGPRVRLERMACRFLVLLGIFFAVAGTYVSLR
eukprot:TRINITY_DN20180_c0_g1_i1.p1 TRINITY_DN20180_c0_g1~~TRINITY_DN20180_c0_g1_i1.p1  ORF type:complete len:523 (+),score=49.96 TRINITY_DN20180_c0_g1_i1:41-1570(+)